MKNQLSFSKSKIYFCAVIILLCGISIGVTGSILSRHFFRKCHRPKPQITQKEWAHNFAISLAEEFNLSEQQKDIAEQAHLDFSNKISKINAKIIPEVLKADTEFLNKIEKILPPENFKKWKQGFIRNRNRRLKIKNNF